MKKFFAFAVLFLTAVTALGQINPYYTFSGGQVISSSAVNYNFTNMGSKALDRTGSGIVTGLVTSTGGGLAGSWSGSPIFTGNPAFSGTPVYSGTPVFAAGASLSGTLSGGPTISGAPTFSGTPVFSTVPTFTSGLGAVSGTTGAFSSTLTSTGLLTASAGVSLGNGQVVFPATQNASSNANTLDDYAEGAWTPRLTDSLSAAPTYAVQAGSYVKIGKQVCVNGAVQVTATSGWTNGSPVRLGNLPYTIENSVATPSFTIGYWDGIGNDGVYYSLHALGIANTTYMNLYVNYSAGFAQILSEHVLPPTTLQLSGCYRATS